MLKVLLSAVVVMAMASPLAASAIAEVEVGTFRESVVPLFLSQTDLLTATAELGPATFFTDVVSASASADVATGKLGVSVKSTGPDGYADGKATVQDTLTFYLADTTPVAVSFGMTVVGESLYTEGGTCATLQTHATVQMSTPGAPVAKTQISPAAVCGVTASQVLVTPLATVLVSNGQVFTFVAELRAEVFEFLSVGTASLDLSHTGTIFLDLPSGVTFTSQSGSFLAGGAATPEPATLTLTALGLAGFVRRYRRPARP